MPYGLIREGKPSVLRVDEAQAAVVVKAYQLAAAGSTDWEVAAQTGLAKTQCQRGPHQPHLRRPAAHRGGGGHRPDRRPLAVVDRPDPTGTPKDQDAGAHREGC